MNVKRFILAGLAGFATMLVLGLLWHAVALGDFFRANLDLAPDTNIAFVIIGYLLLGFVLSLVYPLGYKGRSPAMEGYKFGVLMGLVMSVPMTFIVFLGSGIITPIGVVADLPWHVLVEQGVGGLVIGVVYGKAAP